MEEILPCNHVFLRGVPLGEPVFSHQSRDIRFFSFPLEIERLSGTADRLNVILRESQLPDLRPSRAGLVEIDGELRSFNNRSGEGHRLVITVFARSLRPGTVPEWSNLVELTGTLCKSPNHRTTPLGREICDLMLAVNRPYGRSDYLPCIAWGSTARAARAWDVGQRLELQGRIQSREYIKLSPVGDSSRQIAYEVSAARITPLP